MRRLQTTLLGKSLAPLEQALGQSLGLHKAVKQTGQPFDNPQNSALAVYLHADQTGIQTKSRMLLQVGLQGSTRRSGARPAMNIAVVLDLRGSLDKNTLKKIKDLLLALNKARDIGDRFSLVLAGKAGGLIIKPEQFRHGHLSVAISKLSKQKDGPTLNLSTAMETAIASVSDSDDPTSALGSSAVLLVTKQKIGAELEKITTLAHQSAVAGIPVSTIALDKNVHFTELEQIALAGQGNRRVLGQKHSTDEVVRRELSAVSEIVARAVRLRIRLAPGTKLIKVYGSYRLDEVHAERVRQAEQSIDRRLSRNLGIEADRGEDEEGIQIVIPAFYADTAHVVLLDVVAEKPGPIADVTVRYKDLVHLRNGVNRANLSLSRSLSRPGPLERNVIKNLLAFRMSLALQSASSKLSEGKHAEGLILVEEHLNLLRSFRDNISGYERDADLRTDIALLMEYQRAFALQGNYNLRKQIVDSLALAGKIKILPLPAKD